MASFIDRPAPHTPKRALRNASSPPKVKNSRKSAAQARKSEKARAADWMEGSGSARALNFGDRPAIYTFRAVDEYALDSSFRFSARLSCVASSEAVARRLCEECVGKWYKTHISRDAVLDIAREIEVDFRDGEKSYDEIFDEVWNDYMEKEHPLQREASQESGEEGALCTFELNIYP